MSRDVETDDRIAELETKLEAKNADVRDLATMGTIITSLLEIKPVLSVVMEMAIRLVDGEVGLIMLEEKGELSLKVSWGVKEDFVKSLIYQDGMDLPTYCHRAKETIILNELGIKDETGLSIESIITLPIKSGGKCHGVLMIINKSSGLSFSESDKEILEILLNFVAVAIDNSLLIRDKLERQRMEQEMTIARQIQETILPQNIDRIHGAEIGAMYFPVSEVGGDFYDVVVIDDKKFLVVIGDVSNKGVPAALVMSAAAGIIKAVLSSNPDIAVNALAEKLNDILVRDIIKDREMFVTLFFAKFDLENGVLTFCNAGHLPGLFWDSEDQSIGALSEGGPIVGQFHGLKFQKGERHLKEGDRLFLFTDGLTEAADADNNLFGRERAEQVFSAEIGLSPGEFCRRVKEWVDNFSTGAAKDTHDDFTILQVKVG
jgi:sigma-B regulation protein RsbU (phosphoserine phosphatase)